MTDSAPRPTATAAELPAYLAAAVRAASQQIDDDQALPPVLVERMRESGVFNLLTPLELGGWESSREETLRVYEGLARLDGSVAWNVWTANWGCLAVLVDEGAARTVWDGTRDPILAHSGQLGEAVSVDGGIEVSGVWDLVSGVDIADWLVLATRVDFSDDPAAAPDVRLFFARRDQVTVHNTWDAMGLRGTGSHRVTIDREFVPLNLIANGLNSRIRRPLYLSHLPTLVLPGSAAIAIGLAQSAIDALVDLAEDRWSGHDGQPSRLARAQAFIAGAQAELSAARLLLLAAAASLDRSGEMNEQISLEQRADLRGAMIHAARVCRRVLADVYAHAGSSAVRAGSPIGRAFCDGMVALQHADLAPGILEDVGRVRFGQEPLNGLF